MRSSLPKPFIFVIMPFRKSYDRIYKAIEEVSEKLGAYVERVDKKPFEGTIPDQIYNQITKADVIVAEMSGKNPNVFYEAGYAHALGKHVIFLADNSDIPFDLRIWPHIIYHRRVTDLKKELEDRLEFALNNPEKDLYQYETLIDFFIQNTLLVNNMKFKPKRSASFPLEIEAYNNPEKIPFRDVDFILSFETSDIFFDSGISVSGDIVKKNQVTDSKNGKRIHIIENRFRLVPGERKIFRIDFEVDLKLVGHTEKFILRQMADKKIMEIPFGLDYS